MFLNVRPFTVEQIHSPSIEIHVGGKHIIAVFSVLEQLQLLGFFWIVWYRPPLLDARF